MGKKQEGRKKKSQKEGSERGREREKKGNPFSDDHLTGYMWTFPQKSLSFSVFLSVQFSHSVMFDSLQPHGLKHTRLPCPSPTPRAYSNSCPSSQWCHPAISSSVIPSLPAFNLSQHQGLFH